ncbi:MAG TPA: glycoside hydrolase family 36 protein [Anaerolineales bacterium]|jgi:alpha-galactosidase
MDQIVDLEGIRLAISADEIRERRDFVQLAGARVTLSLPRPPIRFFRHGWQSWSLAAWTELHPLPIPKPHLLHPMQTDLRYAREKQPNGSWVGAVEFDDGNALLLGALGTDAHVALTEGGAGARLEGWFEGGNGEWLAAYGAKHTVFEAYAELLAERFGKARGLPAPRVWCSWYSLYTEIDEPILDKIFRDLGDLPFDVLQVDDGWQIAVGDWEANAKFPAGMTALADKIRSTGRRAGLWLAPLIAVKSSRLFREHRDWFLRDGRGKLVSAAFNWGEQLYALDTTHPAVSDWLANLMKQVRAWGFDYIKLDFLYAGALEGRRHDDMPREAAYRRGLQVLREAMGTDTYFLTCGAPIIPSLGLCDALRVGPDVSNEWENHRDARQLYNLAMPGAKNAIRTTVNRLWLRPLVQPDPDVVYFRTKECKLTRKEKRLLQDLALVCDFKATSDLPQWLSAKELEELRTFLKAAPKVRQLDLYKYQIDQRDLDFSPFVTIPTPLKGAESLAGHFVGWAAGQPIVLKIFDARGRASLKKLRKKL